MSFFSNIWHNWVLAYPWIGVVVGIILVILLWKQPRQTMKLLFMLLILAGAIYLVKGVIDFTTSSAKTTERMIDKGVPQ